MPTAARGVLVVITELGEAEMAISEQGLIIGALIRGKNEQGLFALKKIMDWKNGKYAFFEGDEYPNDHIKKTLRMDILSIIRGAEGDQGTSGTNPAQPAQQRVDISSVHNKALPPPVPPNGVGVPGQQSQPQVTAVIRQPQGEPAYSQNQGYQQAQPAQHHSYPQQPTQQLAPSDPRASSYQQQPGTQQQGMQQQAYSQPSLPRPQPASDAQPVQGYRPPQSLSQAGNSMGANQQSSNSLASNAVPAPAAPSGSKPKKRKFASTNFAMDVFGADAPVAPAPKVEETVEDDLLRNLSDLNRLGSSSPGVRSTTQTAVNPGQGANQSQGAAHQAPSVMPAQSMMPPPGVMPSPPGMMPPSGMMPPAGMIPPSGMMPPAGMMPSANNSGPAAALPSGISAYQHQQTMSELQRQAMADEAALMQAISSTNNPVFVRPGPPGQASDTLMSEQQIRAAQSISGGYAQSEAYKQPNQGLQRPSNQLSNAQQPQPYAPTPAAPPQAAQQATPPQPTGLPRAVSPSGGSFDKSKINPTKTLLESDLFFVDDELTGDQPEPPMPDLVANDIGIAGGYAPSAMSSRQDPYAQEQAVEPESSPSLGANFSQTPSFGPGSTGGASGGGAKNPGSAILESMKRRNLGGQSEEPAATGYGTPAPVPSQLSAPSSPNALSQYNQSGSFGTSSSSEIPSLNQPDLNYPRSGQIGAHDLQPSMQQPTDSSFSNNAYKAQPSPNLPGQPSAYGQPPIYDERGSSPELRTSPELATSSTFPARSQPDSYDDAANPQVGIATSSRIARSVGGQNEKSEKGRKDDAESASTVARSRIRTAPSHESGGFSTFFEKNKMMVIIIGVIFIVLLLVGCAIGALFALHIIKT